MPFEYGVLLPIECKPEQRLPLCRTMPNAWWWSCYQKRWRFVLCTWYLVAPLRCEAWSSRWLLLVVGTKCTLRRCCRRNTCGQEGPCTEGVDDHQPCAETTSRNGCWWSCKTNERQQTMSDAVETRTQREPVCTWDTGEQNKKIDKHLLHCVVQFFVAK